MSYLEDLNMIDNELDGHPLDGLEELSTLLDWTFKRIDENKAVISIQGQFQPYQIHLSWQEDRNAMLMETPLNIAFDDISEAYIPSTLMDINARLWLGHFSYGEDRKLRFKHTLITAFHENIEEVVRVSKEECDRFYTFFTLIQHGDVNDQDRVYLALTDSEGVA